MYNKLQVGFGIMMYAMFIVILLNFSSSEIGLATGSATTSIEGCCGLTCQESAREDCPSEFHENAQCADVTACNVGCCVDSEGYCLSNYLAGNCAAANGKFIAQHECLHEPLCISEPPIGDIRGYIGYPFVFRQDIDGFMFSDDIAGFPGQIFTLKSFIFSDATRARVTAASGDYTKTLALYDDGAHGDGNPEDGLFAAIWRTDDFPLFQGLRRINIEGEADNKELIADYLFLSTTGCFPMQKPWEQTEERRDVIFTSVNPQLSANAVTPREIIGFITTQTPVGETAEINFAEIEEPQTSKDNAVASVRNRCQFYDPQDTIIVLDSQAQQCTQQDNVVHIPPDIVINETARNKVTALHANELLAQFCSFIQTSAQYYLFELEKYKAPEITIFAPINDSAHTTSEIEFSFIINDSLDEQVNYNIYMDMNHPSAILQSGIAARNTPIFQQINISDGYHLVWVEAVDSNGNIGASDEVIIHVNESNFVIDIISLDAIEQNHSPQINFTISYGTSAVVNYSILINATRGSMENAAAFFNSTATASELINVSTALENGTHIIQIIANDNNGRTSSSLPYIFGIGVPEDEVLT